MSIIVYLKQKIQIVLRIFGVNPFERKYEVIPLATRFFRNKPLIEVVFNLLQRSNLNSPTFYFHACSTGEEPYSYMMYNIEHAGLSIRCRSSDLNVDALNRARSAVYDAKTIDVINKDYIGKEYKKYFERVGDLYQIDEKIRFFADEFIVNDYTKNSIDWSLDNCADVVFCNSTLLYHSHKVQEMVLENLCNQALEVLVLTGVENSILEKVLKKYKFSPLKERWGDIYDGCALRRVQTDPVFRTPTTPYLSDKNRAKEQYFRYSVFYRCDGLVAHALDVK